MGQAIDTLVELGPRQPFVAASHGDALRVQPGVAGDGIGHEVIVAVDRRAGSGPVAAWCFGHGATPPFDRPDIRLLLCDQTLTFIRIMGSIGNVNIAI
ncbi:hypothetical protein ACFSTD_19460 [Novosphingobium colocasiae]